jgi:hypothetical protein
VPKMGSRFVAGPAAAPTSERPSGVIAANRQFLLGSDVRKNAPVLANHPPRLLVSPPRFSAYSGDKDRFSKRLLALGFRSGATRCSLTNSSG